MSWFRGKRLLVLSCVAGLMFGLVVTNLVTKEPDRNVQAESYPAATSGSSTQSAEEKAREWQQRLEGFRADRGLETRNAHPGQPAITGDQILVDASADLGGIRPPALEIGWNEGRGIAIVRVIMWPEMYTQMLDKLGLDHSTNPTRLVVSEVAAGQMISLHEVYAELFTASNGRNPDTIFYYIAVNQKTANA